MPNRNLAAPLLKTIHILGICAWIGGGLGIVLLLMLDLRATAAADLQAFNRVIEAIDDWIIAPGACATLLSGLALARARRLTVLGTPWLRFKFFSTMAAILFGFFFVAHWLERMHIYSTSDEFTLFAPPYSHAYVIGAAGCAIQAVVVLTLLAVSVLRPLSRKHPGAECQTRDALLSHAFRPHSEHST